MVRAAAPPDHLSAEARREWRRLAPPLHKAGVLTVAVRAALAAYCQCWARWAEAERRLAETPVLLKTPSDYVQQSPWLTVANKLLELIARYMAVLGLTPSARVRVPAMLAEPEHEPIDKIEIVLVSPNADGTTTELRLDRPGWGADATTRNHERRKPVNRRIEVLDGISADAGRSAPLHPASHSSAYTSPHASCTAAQRTFGRFAQGQEMAGREAGLTPTERFVGYERVSTARQGASGAGGEWTRAGGAEVSH